MSDEPVVTDTERTALAAAYRNAGLTAPDAAPGPARRQGFRDYEGLGLSRTILQGFGAVSDDGLLDGIADDGAAVGLLS